MPKRSPYLFISYRRDDSQWIARALHHHLTERFGSHCVFMDRLEIRGGDDLGGKIERALSEATVVLAIVGREWLTLRDDQGNRRILNKGDWVRREIATALRDGKKLIPLFVDG